jgi:hypothetical protein
MIIRGAVTKSCDQNGAAAQNPGNFWTNRYRKEGLAALTQYGLNRAVD